MTGFLRSFFLQRGWLKLPWKNSWFTLSVFAAAFSGGLLVTDMVAGKSRPGLPLPAISLFVKPGSIDVIAATPGALARLDAGPAQAVPTNFAKVAPGPHQVTVSAPGFDDSVRTVQVKEGTPASIDFGQLRRSTGGLSIVTIPPRAAYTLRGASAENAQVFNGHTPVSFSSLPVDSYQLKVDSSRDGSQTVEVQIQPHKAATETLDLVRATVAADADPAVAKVLLAQADVSTLDAGQQKSYAASLNRAAQEYLKVGAFTQANAALAILKGLGQDTQAQEQHVAEVRDGQREKIAGQVKDLIADGNLGAASSKLKAAQESTPTETSDALNAQFKPQIDPYRQQIDSAIQAANATDPATGYSQLEPLARQHPDDVSLALARAHLLTLMPPDRARVDAQLAALKKFDPESVSSDDAGALQSTVDKFQTKLATFNRLQAAVDAEKKPAGGNSLAQIAKLERQIARDQASINGANGVNHTVDNITSGIFGKHVRVVDVSAAQAEIDRDKARIKEIEAAQLAGQKNVSGAQQQLNAFTSGAPW